MILHLFNDEKVVNRCIENFEKVVPNKNLFICFYEKKLKHVKKHENLFFYNESCSFDNSLLYDIEKIIIHYLDLKKVNFILEHNLINIPCYWCIWGGDLYNTFLVNRGYPIYYESHFLGNFFKIRVHIKNILLRFNIIRTTERIMLDFIKNNITHIISTIDYPIVKKYLGDYIQAERVMGLNYYPIEVILGNLTNETVKGNTILIGNSASFTNNHSYAFKYLSRLNIKNRKIITPLSYGGSPAYIKHIMKKYKEKWLESYNALLNFLPLEEYNNLMLTSDICIFPSWRQEAVGNIIISLYLGSKIFLSIKSPLFEYFQDMGIKIYAIENIKQEDLDTPLNETVRKKNREIIFNAYCEKKTIEAIKQICGTD